MENEFIITQKGLFAICNPPHACRNNGVHTKAQWTQAPWLFGATANGETEGVRVYLCEASVGLLSDENCLLFCVFANPGITFEPL